MSALAARDTRRSSAGKVLAMVLFKFASGVLGAVALAMSVHYLLASFSMFDHLASSWSPAHPGAKLTCAWIFGLTAGLLLGIALAWPSKSEQTIIRECERAHADH